MNYLQTNALEVIDEAYLISDYWHTFCIEEDKFEYNEKILKDIWDSKSICYIIFLVEWKIWSSVRELAIDSGSLNL